MEQERTTDIRTRPRGTGTVRAGSPGPRDLGHLSEVRGWIADYSSAHSWRALPNVLSGWRPAVLASALLAAALSALCASAAGPRTGHPVIAAAGDIACDPADGSYNRGRGTATACRASATSRLLLAGRYDAVLTLGDNQYADGAYDKFRVSYASSWGRVKAITKPSPGNHDYETEDAAGYFRYFERAAGNPLKGYYSFDLGAWHLVSLNSNCSEVGGCGPASPQERWLRRDLSVHRSRCVLAYWHHPRFSSGSHGSDDSTATLWSALAAHGAEIVLSGHEHSYERFAPQSPEGTRDRRHGIRQFVVGTGGRELRGFESPEPNSQRRNSTSFGILALTLRPEGYAWRFVSVDGSFTDRGSAGCH